MRGRGRTLPRSMKLGMFMMPLHPPGRNAWETLAEDREAILLADRLGFEEAFVGEHVTDLAENVTSSMMFLASVADATKRITLGTGTLNMPNTHPATVAAQVAMLDHMLEGRLIMGISPGGLMSDAEVFGNYEKDRNAIFLEAIDMVLEIWRRDGPYDLHGEHFSVTTAQTMIPEIGQGTILKPYQKPHPPIVVTAVAPHSRGVTEAAKRGWTSDLGELPPPRVGRVALAALRRGLRRDRRNSRSGRLARRQVHLRGRRRGHCAALRQVRRRAVPLLLQAAAAQARHGGRPLESLQARPE